MTKIKAEITAYYPSNEGVEGGYFDALGKPLNPEHNTCACPSCIPFHTKIKITGTNTKYDNRIYECLDRGSAIIVDDNGVYRIDLLMHDKNEANNFGRRKNCYIEIINDDFKQYIAKTKTDGLNCRKGPGVKYDIESVLDCDIPLTVIEEKTLTSGSVWCKCKAGYWVNKKYLHFIRYI